MTDIEYEIETDWVQQWGERRQITVVVTLYEVEQSVIAGVHYTTHSTTRRRIQTWNLPVDAEEKR